MKLNEKYFLNSLPFSRAPLRSPPFGRRGV